MVLPLWSQPALLLNLLLLAVLGFVSSMPIESPIIVAFSHRVLNFISSRCFSYFCIMLHLDMLSQYHIQCSEEPLKAAERH